MGLTARKEAMENQALQLNARTALSTTSGKSLTPAEITQLDKIIVRTALSYPSQALSKETLNEFRDAFKDLATLYGTEAVEAALRELRLTTKFFPHPAEITEVIEAQKEEAATKGRWERQEVYMREKDAREKEERANAEFVDMNSIANEFFEKNGVMERAVPVATTEGFTDPNDRVMAAFSRGLSEGKQYEDSVVEQVMAWRQSRGK